MRRMAITEHVRGLPKGSLLFLADASCQIKAKGSSHGSAHSHLKSIHWIDLPVLRTVGSNGSRGRTRTGTDLSVRGILSPLCLPIPPRGLERKQTSRNP